MHTEVKPFRHVSGTTSSTPVLQPYIFWFNKYTPSMVIQCCKFHLNCIEIGEARHRLQFPLKAGFKLSSLPTHVPTKSATIQEIFYTSNMRARLDVLNKKWMCNIVNTVPDHWAPLSPVFRQTAIQTPLFHAFLIPVDADHQRGFNGLIFIKNDQGTKPGGIF
jgi:hypothetical protein